MSKKVERVGLSFSSMLTLLFIGLKLTGNIAWSWWWVLSPTLISGAILLLFVIVLVFGIGIINYLYER